MPEDHAFCTECGAVMAEATTLRPADDSPDLTATISGQYAVETFIQMSQKSAATSKKEGDARAEASTPPPRRAEPVTTPAKVRSRSILHFLLGLAAVLLLGALLFYLVSLILSR